MKHLLVAAFAFALAGNTDSVENGTCGGAMTESDVSYTARDGVELAAGLILPDSDTARVPGVVLIQGSGTSDRRNGWARAFAEELAGCGIAVLLTDKRGSGQSGGSWRDAPFELLASDAVAGLEFLERQPRIDTRRTGFLGLSQGGMIAPLAARRTDRADVLVDVSGGVVPLEQSLLYELEQTYRQRDIPADVAERLQGLARASFAYLRDPAQWDAYLAARNAFVEGDYAAAIESWPDTREDPYWTFWRRNFRYDPAPHWRAATTDMRLPTLVVFGKDDSRDNVDVPASVARFNAATSDAPLAITAVYSDTGHLLVERGEGRLKPAVVKQIADFVIERSGRGA